MLNKHVFFIFGFLKFVRSKPLTGTSNVGAFSSWGDILMIDQYSSEPQTVTPKPLNEFHFYPKFCGTRPERTDEMDRSIHERYAIFSNFLPG